jgi:hypothetical protein
MAFASMVFPGSFDDNRRIMPGVHEPAGAQRLRRFNIDPIDGLGPSRDIPPQIGPKRAEARQPNRRMYGAPGVGVPPVPTEDLLA